jgi:hypothetical protein
VGGVDSLGPGSRPTWLRGRGTSSLDPNQSKQKRHDSSFVWPCLACASLRPRSRPPWLATCAGRDRWDVASYKRGGGGTTSPPCETAFCFYALSGYEQATSAAHRCGHVATSTGSSCLTQPSQPTTLAMEPPPQNHVTGKPPQPRPATTTAATPPRLASTQASHLHCTTCPPLLSHPPSDIH